MKNRQIDRQIDRQKKRNIYIDLQKERYIESYIDHSIQTSGSKNPDREIVDVPRGQKIDRYIDRYKQIDRKILTKQIDK